MGADIGRATGLPDRFMRSADLIVAPMDGELVALSISRGSYFGISGVGARLWELLAEPCNVGGLVRAICAEFDVEAGQATVDVTAFLLDLQENKLLEPAD